jgi:serralysin
MRSKFVTDSQDAYDSCFSAIENWVFTPFSPSADESAHQTPFSPSADQSAHQAPADGSIEISPTPVLTSEAVQSSGAQSGTATVVALTSSGITINLLFDTAAMAAPATFRAGIQQAAAIISSVISDKITVNIKIDYSGTGGGAAAGPDAGFYESYSTVRSDLINNATPGDTTFNALPGGTSIQGQSSVAVWNAQLKLWGFLGANDTTTDDGSATFATDISSGLLVGVALHELTHAMGRVPYGSQPDIFDLFRFTSPGTRLINGASTAPAAYFSLDGGVTKLADYGQFSDPSDFLNSGVQGADDPFNEYYSGSTSQTLSAIDKAQLDALGFHVAAQNIVVTATNSKAIQGGAAVTLLSGPPTTADTASTTLSGATIKIANTGGSAVAGDMLYVNGVQSGSVGSGVTASWNAGTGTLTLNGSATLAIYDTLLSEVSYQDTGTDTSGGSHPPRNVTWTVNDGTDSFGATSQIVIERAPVATVANVALNSGLTTVAASSLFTASDLDGDAITTYAFKDTGNGHFVLNGVVQANNQEIDVTAAQFSQLSYQNAVGTDTVQIRVNDGSLWNSWQSFTVTGPVMTVIQTNGPTSLVAIGNDYFLYNTTSGTGPELSYAGRPFTAGAYGGWTAIGAVQVTGGYDVALKNAAAGQYTVWSTDSNGNYLSSIVAPVSGSSTALQSMETVFHQDLNGDGTIGLPPASATVIQTDATTSLVAAGNDYFLYDTTSGTGPELSYAGTPFTAGAYGGWTAIGAIQVTGGYDVALKNAGAGQYTVWSTDSNGNYLSSIVAPASGSSTALQSIETVFHQDINGDGVIGLPPASATVIQTDATTSLVAAGNDYFLYNTTSGTGPELSYAGTPFTAGAYGGWTAIGAVQVTGGYDVALKNAGVGQYTVWSTDSNGNYLSSIVAPVSASSTALQSIETVFHQDINGDGTIGLPPASATVIQTDATTSLVAAGNDYFLYDTTSGTGPELSYAGTPFTAGAYGGWTAIGAIQVTGGYDVALKNAGAGQYTVWSTDSGGNYLSSIIAPVSGSNTALQSIETVFHQDINGDGVIGIASATSAFQSVSTSAGTELVLADAHTLTVAGGDTLHINDIAINNAGNILVAGTLSVDVSMLTLEGTGTVTLTGGTITGSAAAETLHINGTISGAGTIGDSSGHLALDNAGGTIEANGGTLVVDTGATIANGGTLEAWGGATLIIDDSITGTGGAVIGADATLELAAADSGTIAFNSPTATLILDHPSAFSGHIVGFTGDGTLAASDHIDLRGMTYRSVHASYDSSTGVLDVSDGTTTADIKLAGTYSLADFKFSNDGSGGTIVYGSPTSGQPAGAASGTPSQAAAVSTATVSVAEGQDTFVFAPNLGQVIIANFAPATDMIQISQSIFANMGTLLAATHDDGHGNAVIADAAHDTITLQNVTVAQLLAHQSDFHFV